MIETISKGVWKFSGDSNIYFLDLDKKIIIDTGNRSDRQLIIQFLGKVVDFAQIEVVIFTHLHHDHIGNFDLFPNAKFYASSEAISDLSKARQDTILDKSIAERFNIELNPLPNKMNGLEIVNTPGHTRGSVCIWYPLEQILFSGDTLFFNKNIGRTDLPTSSPSEMNNSLSSLITYNFRILAPGHDY